MSLFLLKPHAPEKTSAYFLTSQALLSKSNDDRSAPPFSKGRLGGIFADNKKIPPPHKERASTPFYKGGITPVYT